MKALTLQAVQRVLFEEVPDPVLSDPGDVILRVRITAICGSDLHVYHGRESGQDAGTVMGHEFVGEVVELGSSVKAFKKGDVVVCPFTTSCGSCYYCRKGLTARCDKGQFFGWVREGKGLHGGQAEFVRVPLADSSLVRVPEGVPQEEVLLAGDNFSTGYFCAEMAAIEPGSVVAVLGCGPVGLMAVLGAREFHAGTIFALDSIPERLKLAEGFGATPLDIRSSNPVEVLQAATEGRGADRVLEVVGNPAATRLAVDLIRPGGTIAAAGVHTEERFAFPPGEAYDKNLTYRAGRCSARHIMDRTLPLIRDRKYDLSAILSHRLPLSEGAKGYELFDRKQDRCTKVILTP